MGRPPCELPPTQGSCVFECACFFLVEVGALVPLCLLGVWFAMLKSASVMASFRMKSLDAKFRNPRSRICSGAENEVAEGRCSQRMKSRLHVGSRSASLTSDFVKSLLCSSGFLSLVLFPESQVLHFLCPGSRQVRLQDVALANKAEVAEVVEFLNSPQRFLAAGARLPRPARCGGSRSS